MQVTPAKRAKLPTCNPCKCFPGGLGTGHSQHSGSRHGGPEEGLVDGIEKSFFALPEVESNTQAGRFGATAVNAKHDTQKLHTGNNLATISREFRNCQTNTT